MDVVDRASRALLEADHLVDAGGNQVVAVLLRKDFLAGQHRRTARQTRKPTAHPAVAHLVVPGDRDGIQALSLGFEDQAPRRQRAVAPHRAVGMEIDGEHAITADRERRTRARPIGHRAGRDGQDQQDDEDEAR
jgi:hypothetical protein